MRVDAQLLDAKIEASGLKTNFIIEKLGLSANGFYKKKNGQTPFRISEVYVLCDLLHIDDSEKEKIFFPKSWVKTHRKEI